MPPYNGVKDDAEPVVPSFSLTDLTKLVFREFTTEYPSLVIGYVVLIVLVAIVNTVLIPRFQGKFIDALKNATGASIPWLALGLYLLFYAIERTLQLSMMYVNQNMMPRFTHFIRMKFFRNTLKAFERNAQLMEQSELITNLAAIPWALYNLFYYLVSVLLLQSVIILGGTLYLTYIDWRVGIVSFLCMGVLGWLFTQGLHRCMNTSYNNYAMEKHVQRHVMDKADNLEVILQQNLQEYETKEYSDIENKRVSVHLTNFKCFFRYKVVMTYVTILLVVSVLIIVLQKWKGAHGQQEGSIMTVGQVVALMSVVTLLGRAYDRIRESMGGINTSLGTLYHEGERLVRKIEEKPSSTHIAHWPGKNAMMVNNLHFAHEGADHALFNNLNMTVPNNQATCIMGPSGSGKSTLFRLITGSHPTYEGQIQVFGKDIRDMDLHQLRSHFMTVPQNPKLFDNTVEYNIMYGNSHATRNQMLQLLDDLHLGPIFDNLPQGLQSQVGAEGKFLSGGQRQATMLLRALLSLAPIILLDEPTSNLDPDSKKVLMSAIRRAGIGRTILIITHDETLGEYCKTTHLEQDDA